MNEQRKADFIEFWGKSVCFLQMAAKRLNELGATLQAHKDYNDSLRDKKLDK